MALAFRCSTHGGERKSCFMRNYERKEEIKKLETAFPPAKSSSKEPVIPKPEIFDVLRTSTADLAAVPRTAECAIHLLLLEKFVALKQKVLTSNAIDRAFGIIPKDKLVTRGGTRQPQADATFKARQAVKWPIFVRISAARFLRWWRTCTATLPTQGSRLLMTESSLPPLGK